MVSAVGGPRPDDQLQQLLHQLLQQLSISTFPPTRVLADFIRSNSVTRAQVSALTELLSLPRSDRGSSQPDIHDLVLAEERSPYSGPTPKQHSEIPAAVEAYTALDAAERFVALADLEYDEFGLPMSIDVPTVAELPTSPEELAIAELMDDWQRQGDLDSADVHRLADRRGLTATQLVEVTRYLEDLGILQLDSATDGKLADNVGKEAASAVPDAVRSYLQSISRNPLIHAEDEVRLGRMIRAGRDAAQALADGAVKDRAGLARLVADGRKAHHKLVCANLRLAVSIAKRYAGAGVDLLDRIQFANIGVMRAADKFDHTRGYKFSTYATWWIRQSISRGLADTGRLIRLPVHMAEKVNRFRAVERQLGVELGRTVTVRELADALGEEAGTVAAILDFDKSVASLDAEVDGDGGFTLADAIADIACGDDPADIVVLASIKRDVDALLSSVLSERERLVINRRFGFCGHEPSTLDSIGADLGLTRERIRQIQGKAMGKLRGCFAADELRALLYDGEPQTSSEVSSANAACSPARRSKTSPSEPVLRTLGHKWLRVTW